MQWLCTYRRCHRQLLAPVQAMHTPRTPVTGGFTGQQAQSETALPDALRLVFSILPANGPETAPFSVRRRSWFPIFFPLKEPVHLGPGEAMTVHMWRCVGSQKVMRRTASSASFAIVRWQVCSPCTLFL